MPPTRITRADREAYQQKITAFAARILDAWTDPDATVAKDAAGFALYAGFIEGEIEHLNRSLYNKFPENAGLRRACLACFAALISQQLVRSAAE